MNEWMKKKEREEKLFFIRAKLLVAADLRLFQLFSGCEEIKNNSFVLFFFLI